MSGELNKDGTITTTRKQAVGIYGQAVDNCARCGGDHVLLFKQFARPIEDSDATLWTHWATCPATGDPILLHIHTQLSHIGGSD